MGDCLGHQILDEKDNSLATGQWIGYSLAVKSLTLMCLAHRYMGRMRMVVEVVECLRWRG